MTRDRKEYNRKYNIEHREEIKARQKAYYVSHQEHLIEYSRKFRLEHEGYVQNYYKEHRDKISEQYKIRWAENTNGYRDRWNEYSINYYWEHKKERSERYKKMMEENTDGFRDKQKEYRLKNRDAIRARQKTRRIENRKSVLEHYGGVPPKCTCCGETTYEFLTIDHINGGGKKHRAEIGGHSYLIHWLQKNNYPEGFQILCYNCNSAKGHYGKCPHQRLMDVQN
jgi:5-methylcytosine-specific restriction endonuclease McrA